MKPSPSIDNMTLFPQFREYGDVFMVRGGAQSSTGRHGLRLVTTAHTFSCIALIVFSVITAFVGAVLLFNASGFYGEAIHRSTAGAAGYAHLGVSLCSLAGAGAVCLHSYRREQAQISARSTG